MRDNVRLIVIPRLPLWGEISSVAKLVAEGLLNVKIPSDAIIANEKLTGYLLVRRARNDKSKFLAQAGFTLENPDALRAAIRLLADETEAMQNRADEYGAFYSVEGILHGINGVDLSVTTIWLEQTADGRFKFITLIPRKELE